MVICWRRLSIFGQWVGHRLLSVQCVISFWEGLQRLQSYWGGYEPDQNALKFRMFMTMRSIRAYNSKTDLSDLSFDLIQCSIYQAADIEALCTHLNCHC